MSFKLVKIDRPLTRTAVFISICIAGYFQFRPIKKQRVRHDIYTIRLCYPPKEVNSGWLWTVPPTIHLINADQITLNSEHIAGQKIDSVIFECSKVQALTLREYQLDVADNLTVGDVAYFSRRIANISERLQQHMVSDPQIKAPGSPIALSIYFNPETNKHANYY